jgi:hypothetical protein
LPLVAFAFFGASKHLVVAADSATAAILAGMLVSVAAPGSSEYVSMTGTVALAAAATLMLAQIFRLGFLADCRAHTCDVWVTLSGYVVHRFDYTLHVSEGNVLAKPSPPVTKPRVSINRYWK